MTMQRLMEIFWNPEDRRLRAAVRLALHAGALAILTPLISTVGTTVMPDADIWGVSLLTPQWLVLMTFIAAGSFLVMYLMGRYVDRRQFSDFGWVPNRRWWQDLVFGFVLAFLLISIIFWLELLFGWVKVTGYFVGEGNFASTIFLGFLFLIVAAIQEETISRSYQLKNLAEGFSFLGQKRALITATLFSSIGFGLMHLWTPHCSFQSIANLTVAGAVYAFAFLITGRIGLPLGMHISWNFFEGLFYGFPVSGTVFDTKLMVIEQSGPELITGGAFGPEAGIIRLPMLFLALAAIYGWTKFQNRDDGQIPEKDMTTAERLQ